MANFEFISGYEVQLDTKSDEYSEENGCCN